MPFAAVLPYLPPPGEQRSSLVGAEQGHECGPPADGAAPARDPPGPRVIADCGARRAGGLPCLGHPLAQPITGVLRGNRCYSGARIPPKVAGWCHGATDPCRQCHQRRRPSPRPHAQQQFHRWIQRERVAVEKHKSFAGQPCWGRPVPDWGAARPRVMVVGLAPAAHGGNRTGRVFIGDRQPR